MIELLKKLAADITFRPDTGGFRSKLIETVIDNAEAERAELFSARNCDIQVSISSRTIEEGVILFFVESDLGEQSLECELSDLNDVEIIDLYGQLSRLVEEQALSESHGAPKVIVRKNYKGMLDIHQTEQKLGCSQAFLKSRIPCTDYTYNEVNGKKEIKEYYWSKQMIDRLCHIKINGVTAEDLKYIAEECCDGDLKWAEDILSSLGRPMTSRKVDPAPSKNVIKQTIKVGPMGTSNNEPSRKKRR